MTRKQFLSLFATASIASAANWPSWRGPARDGKSTETGLLKKWPAGGPPKVWQVNGLGEGFASYSIAGGKLFTQGQRDGKQHLIALDEKSGKKVWETAYGAAYQNRRGHGPRGTPAVDGELIYALASDGGLICAEASTGKKVWGYNVLQKFGGGNISWGLSESPLIDGERLIVNAGGLGASVVALNKKTGYVIWKSQSDEAGYSSAVVAEVGGVRTYVVLTGDAAIGLLASNGELLWRYGKVSNRTANIATPIVHGDHVFVSTDYGTGCALLKLTGPGGAVKADEVYFNRDMRNHYCSSVLHEGHLYGFSSSILTCMEFQTGKVAWVNRSVGKGQVAFADGMLYLLSEDGVVGLAEATSAEYREASRFEMGRGEFPTWTQPVIANGCLYLRDQDVLHCHNVTA
jgi:outer membrane protein assembly factor BamB